MACTAVGKTKKKGQNRRQVISRIAVAEYRMKRYKCPDRYKSEDDKTDAEKASERILVVANVHLHYAVCNNCSNLGNKDMHLREFYDILAKVIIDFKVRLVNGDFNMDTIRAVNE